MSPPLLSPSPEQESGHYWHLARLPNQSPLREVKGGRHRRREGRNKEGSEEQRGKERKSKGEVDYDDDDNDL